MIRVFIFSLLAILFAGCSSQKLTKSYSDSFIQKKRVKHIAKSKKLSVKKRRKVVFHKKIIKHKSNQKIYIVQKGDMLSKIAKMNNISLKSLLAINNIDNINHIEVGQKIYLRTKSIDRLQRVAKIKKSYKQKKKIVKVAKKVYKKKKIIPIVSLAYKKKRFTKSIRLTATAYTSHKDQTDDTPFLAAWNNRIKPGMKIIAVSPDLIKKYGLTNGTRVKIKGLKHHYVIRDKMNAKWKNRIDIYMGLNKYQAYQWGKREVTLIW